MLKSFLPAALLTAGQLSAVWADTASHKYEKDEHVELWVNKVRPYYSCQALCFTHFHYSLTLYIILFLL